MRFELSEYVRHESFDPVLGHVEFEADAGAVTPKNEQEEAALMKLVEHGEHLDELDGIAKITDDSTPPYRRDRDRERQKRRSTDTTAATPEPTETTPAPEPEPTAKKSTRKSTRKRS